MEKKPRAGQESAAIGALHINLAEGTAHLSNMMQSYKTRLRGVSYDNADGVNRQDIIRSCTIGEKVELVREPKNPNDKAAIAVHCRGQQIGYLPAGDQRLAIHMDAGFEVFAHIAAIDGGPTFAERWCWWRRPKGYGCVVQIDKGYKKRLDESKR